MFQSQGRFFGGSNCLDAMVNEQTVRVSIAGAILLGSNWPGVDPGNGWCSCFNRRGDSLGGATRLRAIFPWHLEAGFQSQGRFFEGSNRLPRPWKPVHPERFQSQGRFFGGSNTISAGGSLLDDVSIAGAILWGEQPLTSAEMLPRSVSFNRRGDSLGEQRRTNPAAIISVNKVFQSQGRFFGGSNELLKSKLRRMAMQFVSIAGAILWGEQPSEIDSRIIGQVCFNRRGDSFRGSNSTLA